MACGACGGRKSGGASGVEYLARSRDGGQSVKVATVGEARNLIKQWGGGTFKAVAKSARDTE